MLDDLAGRFGAFGIDRPLRLLERRRSSGAPAFGAGRRRRSGSRSERGPGAGSAAALRSLRRLGRQLRPLTSSESQIGDVQFIPLPSRNRLATVRSFRQQ